MKFDIWIQILHWNFYCEIFAIGFPKVNIAWIIYCSTPNLCFGNSFPHKAKMSSGPGTCMCTHIRIRSYRAGILTWLWHLSALDQLMHSADQVRENIFLASMWRFGKQNNLLEELFEIFLQKMIKETTTQNVLSASIIGFLDELSPDHTSH